MIYRVVLLNVWILSTAIPQFIRIFISQPCFSTWYLTEYDSKNMLQAEWIELIVSCNYSFTTSRSTSFIFPHLLTEQSDSIHHLWFGSPHTFLIGEAPFWRNGVVLNGNYQTNNLKRSKRLIELRNFFKKYIDCSVEIGGIISSSLVILKNSLILIFFCHVNLIQSLTVSCLRKNEKMEVFSPMAKYCWPI